VIARRTPAMAAYDFRFVKDRYDFELLRKEQLTNALTMPITAMSIVGSLLVAMGRTFSFRESPVWWFFVPLFVIDILSFVMCLIQLARAYHLQTYTYLGMLGEMEQMLWSWRQIYADAQMKDADVAFDEELRRRIINATDVNVATNEIRSDRLRIARLWLFAVLWLTFFVGLPYFADRVLEMR
jgi:hypothetical protein